MIIHLIKVGVYRDTILPKPEKKHFRIKGRAMTICAAIRCADGIVLAADREITRGDTKYYETKLFTVNNSPEWSITFGYAGHPDFAKTIYNKLLPFSAHL